MSKSPEERRADFLRQCEEISGDIRQETKRTDLPEETVRLLSSAYLAIGELLRMEAEDIRTIERLESQYGVVYDAKTEAEEKIAKMKTADNELFAKLAYDLDDAEKRIARMRAGFEGCCPLCETVGSLNLKLDAELRAVRREFCMMMAGKGGRSSSESPDAVEYAQSRGWDCFDGGPNV